MSFHTRVKETEASLLQLKQFTATFTAVHHLHLSNLHILPTICHNIYGKYTHTLTQQYTLGLSAGQTQLEGS